MSTSANKPLVKLSSITNLHDARYGAGMGVDMLGFCLSPQSPSFIDEEVFTQILGWITGIDIVLEIEGKTLSDLAQKILDSDAQAIAYLQTDSVELVQTLKSYELPIILKVSSFKEIEQLGSLPMAIKFVLLANQEKELDLAQVKKFATQYPLILENAVTSKTLSLLHAVSELKGIAFKGGREEQVGYGGYQDFNEISSMLEMLEDNL